MILVWNEGGKIIIIIVNFACLNEEILFKMVCTNDGECNVKVKKISMRAGVRGASIAVGKCVRKIITLYQNEPP